jgi:hypothetical protein
MKTTIVSMIMGIALTSPLLSACGGQAEDAAVGQGAIASQAHALTSCYYTSCAGKDPYAEGCYGDAQILAFAINGDSSGSVAFIGSAACHAVWSVGQETGSHTDMCVYTDVTSGELGTCYGTSTASQLSPMLAAQDGDYGGGWLLVSPGSRDAFTPSIRISF